MSLHPKTREVVEAGLFSGIATFDELEERISSLESNKQKGDAFEVFAEAYLATQRKHDVATIWPQEATPSDVIGKLRLTDSDYGVDGVFKTAFGDFNAYQVKFRTDRSPLTWQELSTFIGLSDSEEISCRILFTNSEDVPSVLDDRRGFFCIRGSDLDRLSSLDFQEIECWLKAAPFEDHRKQPRQHQEEALGAIIPALESGDRTTAVMACGTGKTLVTLWVAERMGSRLILVLLPSLALLRQTLHEWLCETTIEPLAYLCVCSDPTVTAGIDSARTKQSDLDFQVLTDRQNVRDFLDKDFQGTKVVFSTYQSAPVVGSALKPGEAFELGIFDEAHKTAGRGGRNYAFALDDKNILIRKRLFVTATPRKYNPHKRDKDGDSSMVLSMDNPEIYGAQSYTLSFSEAADRGIICNYRVIVTVITSESVSAELLGRGDTEVHGDDIRSRQVANQIALCEAVSKYGVRKVFTFHKSIASAASFVSKDSEGVGAHLPKFGTLHVSGQMTTARREKVMKEFRSNENAVISNARCLTEGVDVPAVDMVAFLSPRRSMIDIVQATGRAMRNAPGKDMGYVLVPLYVELVQGETVDEAVDRSDFSEVWDVLQSLQEGDEVLAELIQGAAANTGRGRGFDDQFFNERIIFEGVGISLGTLQKAISTRCVERLSSSWDRHFGRLLEFKERFGHANVLMSWDEEPTLGGWVVAQRVRKKKDQLSQSRIQRLDEIGFTWDYQEQKALDTWMKWYQELQKYIADNGNADVPARHANSRLASWVWQQRLRRGKSYQSEPPLSEEQERLLDELDFSWDIRSRKWEAQYKKLKEFWLQHGHCEVERRGDRSLEAWLRNQRKAYRSGKLDDQCQKKLSAISPSWADPPTIIDPRWMVHYESLKQYFEAHGNADVPSRWEEDPSLGSWVSEQRQRRKGGRLEADRVHLLDKLNFTWKMRERGTWEDCLEEVAKFKEIHGHCNIPTKNPENPKLGGFINNTRSQRRRGELSADRIAKLDKIGFVWQQPHAQNKRWEERFAELIEFREAHGHCDVPSNYPENPLLENWAYRQRDAKKKGKLDADHIERLEAVGFRWTGVKPGQKKPWEERYQDLLRYKERHGNCNVPIRYAEDPQLGGWVYGQRRKRKEGKLTSEQEEKLNNAGFLWEQKKRKRKSK